MKINLRTTLRTSTAALTVVALAATSAACGSSKATGGTGGTAADGVKMGPGVTDKVIKVGIASDLTGVYAPVGKSITQAQQLHFEEVNNVGGVCGRKIEVVVRDHGYDVQKAMSAYSELNTSTLGIAHFIGSPMVTALKSRITTDKMFVIPMAFATTLLGSQYIQVLGTTYDIDTINGVDWLMKKKGVKKGDKIGHVYFEGDYGASSLNGTKYAAKQSGLTIVEQKIKPTDTDMTAQVAAFKNAGVTAIIMSAGPKQSASLAGVARAKGINVPILASNSGFLPQLLQTPAAPALLKNFYLTSSGAPIGAPLPAVQKLAAAYAKKYAGQPLDHTVVTGYSAAGFFTDALKKACENKDLTRDGLIKAHRANARFDDGLGTVMDFSYFDKPSTRKTYVLRTDAKTPGGLAIELEATESDQAKTYQAPVSG